MKPVPARITAALDARQMYGPEVDRACGVEEPAVDRWETGELVPTAAQVARLALLTGYPVAFFYRPMPEMGPVFICGDIGPAGPSVPPRRAATATKPARRGAVRPWERELAAREARTPQEAIARFERGMALARAAAAGNPLPEPSRQHERTQEPRPAGYEQVACAACYRPIWATPGARCDTCQTAPAPAPLP